MNTVVVSGFKVQKTVSGDDFIRFLVVSKSGYSKKEEKDLTELVPCCLFNPSDKVREILSSEESLFLELRGRVSSSKYEDDGKTFYSTKVIVDGKTLNFIRYKQDQK